MTKEPDADIVETTIHSESVFEGNLLKVRRDTVRLPNGRQATREYIQHPGAVVIIARLDDGRVIMVRQYRYAVQQVILEFPAGKLDPGESPLICAQRELLEETGYTADRWSAAGEMHLAVGYADEVIHIFFAEGLTAGASRLDDDEFVEVELMTVEQILHACRSGGITDAKSLSCSLWLQNVDGGQWSLS